MTNHCFTDHEHDRGILILEQDFKFATANLKAQPQFQLILGGFPLG